MPNLYISLFIGNQDISNVIRDLCLLYFFSSFSLSFVSFFLRIFLCRVFYVFSRVVPSYHNRHLFRRFLYLLHFDHLFLHVQVSRCLFGGAPVMCKFQWIRVRMRICGTKVHKYLEYPRSFRITIIKAYLIFFLFLLLFSGNLHRKTILLWQRPGM